jgi:hypothetical protein
MAGITLVDGKAQLPSRTFKGVADAKATLAGLAKDAKGLGDLPAKADAAVAAINDVLGMVSAAAVKPRPPKTATPETAPAPAKTEANETRQTVPAKK